VSGQRHASAALSWVGPTAGLDEYGKSRPPLGFDHRTVQPVTSRRTDCRGTQSVFECSSDVLYTSIGQTVQIAMNIGNG